MEEKTKALKNASKVIAVIMKIGYTAMIVAMCVCVVTLIFLAATGGETSVVTSKGTFIGVADSSVSPEQVIAVSVECLVMGGFLFVIFLLAQKMFFTISVSGNPFTEKYVKSVRAIGILVASMSVASGLVNTLMSFFMPVEALKAYIEAPGIVFGAVIFCLSYIIDYGCALKAADKSE